jgi:hypothetical protein
MSTSPVPPCSVVILGMPRSGTSLTSSIFARAGYYTGERLRPADAANPLGYFQSEILTALNAALYARAGYPHHNTWLYEPIAPSTLERLEALPPTEEHRRFVAEFERHAPWVWKDPRLCMTLGFWWPLLDRERTRALLVRRDKAAIHHSFEVQNWLKDGRLSRHEVYDRIDQHIEHALATMGRLGIPYLEVWYEDLLASPGPVIDRINAFTGASLQAEHVDVRPELNHSSRRNRLAFAAVALSRRWPAIARVAKAVLPARILHLVFPERRQVPRQAGPRAAGS